MSNLDIGISILHNGTLYQGIAQLQPVIQPANNQPEPAQPANNQPEPAQPINNQPAQSPNSEQDAEGEEEIPEVVIRLRKGQTVKDLTPEEHEIYKRQEREKKQRTRDKRRMELGIHSKTSHLKKKK